MCTSADACECTRAPTPHTYPDTYTYEILQCHPNTPPQIALPIGSVARIRKRGDTAKVGYLIDEDVDSKYADAHEGPRPPEENDTDADASRNCADTEVGKLKRESPAKAIALHGNIPFCSRSGFLSRRSPFVVLEAHQSAMMSLASAAKRFRARS